MTFAAILLGGSTSLVSASTTVEHTGLCTYSDASGRSVFDGECLINWGTGSAQGCPGADFSDRYIVTYSPRSEATFYFLCDGTVEVNGSRASYTQSHRSNVPMLVVRTQAGETFEFAVVSE